jgi:5-oxoprolinase (ATP-hydrolysing)
VLPELLYERVIEAEERMGAHGELLQPLDEAHLRERLWAAFDAGIRAVAVVFMHGYRYTAHEQAGGRASRARSASRRSAPATRSAR